MTRKTLIANVRKAAELCAYKFYTGMEYRINTDVREIPALWMLPPKLLETSGRQEGVKQYEVKIILIDKCEKHTQEWKEDKWGQMEKDIEYVYKIILDEVDTRNITDREYHTNEFSITNRGEISITTSAKVKINF